MATDGSGHQTYFLYDGLGCTSDLTDGSGNVVDRVRYYPYSGVRTQESSASAYLSGRCGVPA